MFYKHPLKKGSHFYLGRQRLAVKRGRDVAIKLLERDEKILKEIDFLLKLGSHPNIVQIFEAGSCIRRLYDHIHRSDPDRSDSGH